MTVRLLARNESARKGLYRSDALARLAAGILDSEGVAEEAEVSVLFCDDPFMRELNRQYRKKDAPTDVLSFCQDAPPPGEVRALGDIVISLETVAGHHPGDPAAMRREVRLLFCHGMLHLLGYDHTNARDRDIMAAKQAAALGVPAGEAWRHGTSG